jgi:hypothetical protein
MQGRDGDQTQIENIQISTNPDSCDPGSEGGYQYCAIDGSPLQFSLGTTDDACRQQLDQTYYNTQEGMYTSVNGTGYRVWEHKSGENATCYNNNNAYYVYNTWQAVPDDIQLTLNPDPC